MKSVDVQAAMRWLDERDVIDCSGGVTTYDGFESAVWLLKPQWFHPDLVALNEDFPRLDFPNDHPPVILDGVEINQHVGLDAPRFRAAPSPPWRALTQRELFSSMDWPFNLFDVLSGIRSDVPWHRQPPCLDTSWGLDEPDASMLFDILERHSQSGASTVVNSYYCTLHGLMSDRTLGEDGQLIGDLDAMYEGTLGELRASVASPDVEDPPCNIWPLDHSWLYCDDYDLQSGIFIAGSAQLIRDIVQCDGLEAIESTPENDPWRHWSAQDSFRRIRKSRPLI